MNRRLFAQVALCGAGMQMLGRCGADEPTVAPSAGTAEPQLNSGAGGIAEPVCVADFRALAQARLPRATFDYIETGSLDEVTLRDNVAAFHGLKLVPPVLSGVAEADLSTTALKQPIKLPILLAPVAAQRMYHAQGALAAARGAAACGTIFGTSSSAGSSVEEIAAASEGPKWFQLYVPKDRAVARKHVERAERAGYRALVVTVDLGEWKDADRRNRFMLPRDMLLKHLRDTGFNSLQDSTSYEELIAFNRAAWDLTFSWDIFAWLRSITRLPLVIKGVLRPEDAKKAVDLGLDGIIVSNHGGRRLDTMPASIDMLADVVKAVDGKAEVFLDSGVRRGTDVLKALALGARAVLIGRPYVWGLAAGGEDGVRRVIELLRDELQNAMTACGCARVSDIGSGLILKG
jgi:isopentenyl diphosphate isomerase/L-lactate dehydrogenase-like FMN-dependent dehydrogenase